MKLYLFKIIQTGFIMEIINKTHHFSCFLPVLIVVIVGVFHVIWTFFCDYIRRIKSRDYNLLYDDLAVLIGTGAITYVLCSNGLSSVAWATLIPVTLITSASLYYHTIQEFKRSF